MKKLLLTLLGVALIGFIGASIVGHPIYGERFIVDNRPLLSHPLSISRLEDPNVVVTTTGQRLAIEGIVFEEGLSDLSPEELSRGFLDSNPIRIAEDPTLPSKVAFEWKIGYFCGNSFRPARFFPKSLPSYQVADFGHGLVMRGLAQKLGKKQAAVAPSAGSEN